MPPQPDDDVVVTGMGVVTPGGCTLPELWSALRAGRSLATKLDEQTFGRHRVRIGCPVRGLVAAEESADGISAKQTRRSDPFARYALVAAASAIADAGHPPVEGERAAVVVGNAVGGRWTSDQESC